MTSGTGKHELNKAASTNNIADHCLEKYDGSHTVL